VTFSPCRGFLEVLLFGESDLSGSADFDLSGPRGSGRWLKRGIVFAMVRIEIFTFSGYSYVSRREKCRVRSTGEAFILRQLLHIFQNRNEASQNFSFSNKAARSLTFNCQHNTIYLSFDLRSTPRSDFKTVSLLICFSKILTLSFLNRTTMVSK
jgi:hypothetical protein